MATAMTMFHQSLMVGDELSGSEHSWMSAKVTIDVVESLAGDGVYSSVVNG